MTKKICFSFLFTLVASFGFSQDSLQRKASHYIGIQANQLFRQILNLSNSNTAIDNPYLITYSVNSNSNGSGLNVALGYTYNQFKSGDAINRLQSEIESLFFRAGYEKKSSLGKRWIVSWGFDLVIDHTRNVTKNVTNNPNFPGSDQFETTTISQAVGTGPRFTLNYKITEQILIGTESTYYFKTGKNSLKRDDIDDDTSDKFKQFKLTLPVALYLIVKF